MVFPVTPYDAKGMMNAALAGTDPVVFFESQKIYDYGEMFVEEGVPEGYYEIDLSQPSIKRKGKDITIISFGPALYTAIAAADELKAYGLDAEVIDLRTANPLNYDQLMESVRKTGKVVLISDAVERGGVRQNVAANLTQLCFDSLDGPPVVIGSRNWITPAPELESSLFPAAVLGSRCDPRTDSSFEGLQGSLQPNAGGTVTTSAAWRVDAIDWQIEN